MERITDCLVTFTFGQTENKSPCQKELISLAYFTKCDSSGDRRPSNKVYSRKSVVCGRASYRRN